jgi:hypothetical protein
MMSIIKRILSKNKPTYSLEKRICDNIQDEKVQLELIEFIKQEIIQFSGPTTRFVLTPGYYKETWVSTCGLIETWHEDQVL